MKNLKNLFAKIGVGLAAVGVMLVGASAHAADIETGFDATSTQTMLTTVFGNMTPTLKVGIVAVLGVSLGIWVVFFLIGKLKKHTR